jgi:hypothetical protein
MEKQIKNPLVEFLYRGGGRGSRAVQASVFRIELSLRAWKQLRLDCGPLDDLKEDPADRSFYGIPITTPELIGDAEWRLVNVKDEVNLRGQVV